MTSTYRVGIIGAGMIANSAHIPAWRDLSDDVELVALSDPVRERGELVAATHGVPNVFVDTDEMLATMDLDVVSVCTANVYHKDMTIAALEAGAHVLCEKPVATSHADARAMYDTAEACGRVLMVGQSLRFSPRSMAARHMAEDGVLGDVYFAETWSMRRRGIPTWGQFHMKQHSGGGPVFDLGVHSLDLLLWIMGNPRVTAVSSAVYSKIGACETGLVTTLASSGAPEGVPLPRQFDREEFDVEDMASGFLRCANGATVQFKCSWAANIPENTGGSRILGTEGGLTWDPLTVVTNMGRYQVNATPKLGESRKVAFSGHWEETAHLVRVLRGQERLLVRREEVLNVMRALEAIYESSRVGTEIQLDHDDPHD